MRPLEARQTPGASINLSGAVDAEQRRVGYLQAMEQTTWAYAATLTT